MPSFEEHCRECQMRLGERFEQVHHWLGELAHNPHLFIQHRQFRHNQKGIGMQKNIYDFSINMREG